MDEYYLAVQSYLKLADQALRARAARLSAETTKTSRFYNRVAHTRAMLEELEVLRGLLVQDPDNWDEEPDSVPF